MTAAIDDDKKSAWAVDGQIGKDQAAAFDFRRASRIRGRHGAFDHASVRSEHRPCDRPAAPGDFDCGGARGPRCAGRATERRRDRSRWPGPARIAPRPRHAPRCCSGSRISTPDRARSIARREHAAQAPQPTLTKVLITSEGLPAVRLHTQGDDFLKETHFLERGDPNRKKEVATQGFLQVLMTSTDAERAWQNAPPKGWRGVVSPPGPGRVADRSKAQHRGPARASDREPAVAASPGTRHRRHAQRFRDARRAADASRAVGLPGRRADRQRLATETDPSLDHDQFGLHAGDRCGQSAGESRSR